MELGKVIPGKYPFKLRLSVFIVLFCFCCISRAAPIDGFNSSQPFDEQIRQQTIDDVRILIDAADSFDATRPTLLIFYALPVGNSIEQTVGCREAQGRDWHFYIQHIGAQTRALRAVDPDENIVVAYLEATADVGRSWPAWRQKRADNADRIRKLVDAIAREMPGKSSIVLSGHSGGGGFISGYINSAEAIDNRVVRIVYLDANYSFSNDEHHGEKLLAWLKRDREHQLVVIAYDDRNIELNGKRVVSDTGGTWRASYRMIDAFKTDVSLAQSTFVKDFDTFDGLDGQIRFFLHRNPNNIILHTRLVGEMNGFLAAMTINTSRQKAWGEFAGAPAYEKWISQDPIALEPEKTPATTAAVEHVLNIPARPADALTGNAFIQRVADLGRDEREDAIFEQVRKGNVPTFLRTLLPIDAKFTGADGVPHLAEFYVAPDYVAVGSDGDFVRMPMLPATAQKIADLLDCALPTRKMVDTIDAHATVKLEPQPMTENRESPMTFLEHNRLIERQRTGHASGELICGIKKDIVVTNRLQEKPHRVAIYGWRKLDGSPIQPLTIVHADTYADYSHGVRLIARRMMVDGKITTIDDVLKDASLCGLLSDEGVIEKARY